LADRINEKEKPNSDYQQELSVMQPRAVMRHNVEVTGAAQLYRAASVLTAKLENYFARRYKSF
jgi:hypothetical protein